MDVMIEKERCMRLCQCWGRFLETAGPCRRCKVARECRKMTERLNSAYPPSAPKDGDGDGGVVMEPDPLKYLVDLLSAKYKVKAGRKKNVREWFFRDEDGNPVFYVAAVDSGKVKLRSAKSPARVLDGLGDVAAVERLLREML